MVLFSLKAKSEYSIKENLLILDNGLICMILCMVCICMAFTCLSLIQEQLDLGNNHVNT